MFLSLLVDNPEDTCLAGRCSGSCDSSKSTLPRGRTCFAIYSLLTAEIMVNLVPIVCDEIGEGEVDRYPDGW